MGLGAEKVIFTERDYSQYISQVVKGICCLQGICERGPINDPQKVSSWPEFGRIFGNLIVGEDFPLVCKRLLDRGGVIWVNRLEHYDDITDNTSVAADTATTGNISDRAGGSAAQPTIKIDAHDPGLWGNSVQVVIADGGYDSDNEFNLSVVYSGQAGMDEYFENLSMDPAAKNYFVNRINNKSNLIAASDLESASAAPLNRPANGTYDLTGGTDAYDEMVNADYIGDETAKTGLCAFDDVDDSMYLSTPGVTEVAVIAAGKIPSEVAAIVKALEETTQAIEVSARAIADNRIENREWSEVDREILEGIEQLYTLRAVLERKWKEDNR